MISTLQIRKIAITASKENAFLMPANPKMDPENRVKIATTVVTSRKWKELLDQTMPSAEAEGACAVLVVEAAEDPVVTEEAVVVAEEANAILIESLATIGRKLFTNLTIKKILIKITHI